MSHDNYAARACAVNRVRPLRTHLRHLFHFGSARVPRWKRRNCAYECGIFRFTPRWRALLDESLHQLGELHEISHPHNPPAIAHRDLEIGRHDVRPLQRHRAHGGLVDLEQEPRTVPVVPLPDADKLPPAERVERVRHPYKMRRCARSARTPS